MTSTSVLDKRSKRKVVLQAGIPYKANGRPSSLLILYLTPQPTRVSKYLTKCEHSYEEIHS